jgi:imidazolonepropionase
MSFDINVTHAAQLALVRDDGGPRRGAKQGELDLVPDGGVAIRDGRIVAVGTSENVVKECGDAPTIDATGMTVLPGLVECHCHPMFAGTRDWEYERRLQGASRQEIRAEGGGIWSTVVKTRQASDELLVSRAVDSYKAFLAGGVTTLEVKSGYGLTTEQELRLLRLLRRSAAGTPMDLVYTFLGAHIAPHDGANPESYAHVVRDVMLPAVRTQGIAEFHDVSCEEGDFSAPLACELLAASRAMGLPTRVHADAASASLGWRTAVEGGAVAADHLTYTPDDEIRAMGATDTIAVLLPIAEQFYLDAKRANARLYVDEEVPVAIATDYCSSFHATSLLLSVALASTWFRLTPAEAIVGATLNAAYVLGRGKDRGSLDLGKRGDVTILACPHPNEVGVRIGAPLVRYVVSEGRVVFSADDTWRVADQSSTDSSQAVAVSP